MMATATTLIVQAVRFILANKCQQLWHQQMMMESVPRQQQSTNQKECTEVPIEDKDLLKELYTLMTIVIVQAVRFTSKESLESPNQKP